jgi:hypothetical protein
MPRNFRQLALVNKAKYETLPLFLQCKQSIPIILTYEKDFKLWLQKFKGVSTKYLDNYLALFKFLNTYKNIEKTLLLIFSSLYSNIQTFNSIRKAKVDFS